MDLVWSDEAWDDYLYWKKNNPKIKNRINELIDNVLLTPFEGVGKPEALK